MNGATRLHLPTLLPLRLPLARSSLAKSSTHIRHSEGPFGNPTNRNKPDFSMVFWAISGLEWLDDGRALKSDNVAFRYGP